MSRPFESIEDAIEKLGGTGYVADRAIGTTLFLAGALERPILVEGPAGVGKTELAKATAAATGRELIRLQCYEGLDEARTLFEWKYGKQLLYSQLLRDHVAELTAGATDLREAAARLAAADDAFFSEPFLDARPLLQAIRAPAPVVLLIDEIDRAEDELEAFFLEVLAEWQVTVPELGTLRAIHPPLVVLTSNATRELSDALRRRCLFLAIDLPDARREAAIIARRVPGIAERLAGEVARFVAAVRGLELKKPPSIAESIDWARALVVLAAPELGDDAVRASLTALVKFPGDAALVAGDLPRLLATARTS
jgi:MoxR-like ATPase